MARYQLAIGERPVEPSASIPLQPRPQSPATVSSVPWLTVDTWILVALLGAGAAIRFWHLGQPPEIVFDEAFFVGQAQHYIRNQPFLDTHPPFAKLLIALGIILFGDHPGSWRLPIAATGTALVGVTYLLARSMFHSRGAGALAASFVLTDGLFIVDSRIACIDIIYLTFAAISYLLLFRFLQSHQPKERFHALMGIGTALGFCLASKLYVPLITFALVIGSIVFVLVKPSSKIYWPGLRKPRLVAGVVLLTGSIAAFVYLATFLPHFLLGWWGGIGDLLSYYRTVMAYERDLGTTTHAYASPWWSWPLMLRPVTYWRQLQPSGSVAMIWAGGNPLLWWAMIPAIALTGVRLLSEADFSRGFLLVGYFAYLVAWIPVSRILFIYHYAPSLYLGYLALAGLLADLWQGKCSRLETLLLLSTMFPALLLGLGHISLVSASGWLPARMLALVGMVPLIFIVLAGVRLSNHPLALNRFVFVTLLMAAFALFIFYLPLWLGLPISQSGCYARIWFQGPGLADWI